MILKVTVCGFLGTFFCGASLAATIYVDQASGDDMNNGLTQATAVATITQGSNLINAGDTLNIGAGTYSESSGENFPLNFIQSVNLEGAGPDQTILDGELSTSFMSMTGINATVNIHGLAFINSDGGAIHVVALDQLNFSDCRFENNSDTVGGGVSVFDTALISVTECLFDGNDAVVGAGIQVQINSDTDVDMVVLKSTFSNNTSNLGSAIQFQENGDGIHFLQVNQSRFINNSGSVIDIFANSINSFSQITNSLFVDNSGTAILARDTDIDVVNVTFFDNQTAVRVGNLANVVNSIFWQNVTALAGTGGAISFSIIEDIDIGGHIDGGNNMNLDPLLDANYRLTPNSPAIDMGSDQAGDDLDLIEDLDGGSRKINALNLNRPEGIIDIGADEAPDLIFLDGFES